MLFSTSRYTSPFTSISAVDSFNRLLSDLDIPRQWRAWSDTDFDEPSQSYTVTLELPGYKREDITIEADHSLVTITAKNDRRGTITRNYEAEGLDAEKISAKLEDGILTVTIPLAKSAQKRKVEVK